MVVDPTLAAGTQWRRLDRPGNRTIRRTSAEALAAKEGSCT